MTGCSWAGCKSRSEGHVDGWEMCGPCRALHYALERDDDRLFRQPVKRAPVKDAANPAQPLRQRSDAGKRRDIDSPLNRCRTCGEWRYGRQACGVCEVAA